MRSNRGIVLIALIMVIVLLAIVAFGIVFYISEGLRFNVMNLGRDQAFYAAQAGLMQAIVDYANNGSITEAADVSLADNLSFSIGGSGMFFLADCSNPRIIAGRKLKDISMTNLNSADDITITHMEVSWTPDGGENLTSIDLGRGVVEWTGSASSGTNIDMSDFTIPAGVTENDVWLDWEIGSNILPMTISAMITFSDNSGVEIMLLDEGAGSVNAIIITSTGEAVTPFTYIRTLKAGYDVGTNEIISWEESQDHL
ncbi:hypothetical protein ACFL1K_01435 [Candidatus Omnitrophota bacterium]